MINFRFLFKRMNNINYRGFFESAKRISKVNGKAWPLNFVDCIKCYVKHGSGYIDFETFEMYNMTEEERSKVLTITRNNSLVTSLNDFDYIHFFEDKADFNRKFDKFIKRDWLLLTEENFDEFLKFIEGKDKIIAKPLDLSCGKGIDIYHMKDYAPEDLYKFLMDHKAYLVEEVIEQSDDMKVLCESSVNTVRIVTILNGDTVNLAAGCLRMGRNGNVVDNFNSGGISGILDTSKGMIVTDGFDKFRDNYPAHPNTGTMINGFRIPMWEEIKDMITEAARLIPQVRYVAWDVAISKEHGPLLIEGNSYPGQDLSQYPKLNLGTYDAFCKIIK